MTEGPGFGKETVAGVPAGLGVALGCQITDSSPRYRRRWKRWAARSVRWAIARLTHVERTWLKPDGLDIRRVKLMEASLVPRKDVRFVNVPFVSGAALDDLSRDVFAPGAFHVEEKDDS